MSEVTTLQSAAAETGSREFLVFSLGDEEYAVDILKVQEIRGYDNVTRIANAPDFIKGVSNLRGVIVPIVDLRIKFRLEAEYDEHTVVIVVNIAGRVVGIVVDRVSDVMTLTGEQIKPPPEFGVGLPLDYIGGLGNLDERMLVLVDIEKLLTSEEMALVEGVSE
ncbi:chemotaxis protein CheW [Microbulbifer sp.]|uniref:chemotaxis protein CheW n=1 Tax=Microbulbifer sp. TaxID=1908541 RepID=UPI003F3954DA